MASDKSQPLSRDQMLQFVAAEQKYVKAQSYALALRGKASKITNEQEGEKMIQEAFEKEIEAHGYSKFAQRLQNGTWQSGAAGGGIGQGSGIGLGTVVGTTVGTLVGGLVLIPTTGLDVLIGAGVRAAHGPWIKLGSKQKKSEDASPEEVVDALEQERAKQTEALQEQAGKAGEGGGDETLPHPETLGAPARRKPRKIEIRSQNAKNSPEPVSKSGATFDEKRRPKKLQSRSASNANLPVTSNKENESGGQAQ